MKKEEHKAILDQIKNATTDIDRMTLLVQLENDYTSVLAERDTAVTEKDNAIGERDRYAKLNNELWLSNSAQSRVGKETLANTDTTDEAGGEPPKKMTYEDLEKDF